jgi:hypothetical protein
MKISAMRAVLAPGHSLPAVTTRHDDCGIAGTQAGRASRQNNRKTPNPAEDKSKRILLCWFDERLFVVTVVRRDS